jgi:hypothetical protein
LYFCEDEDICEVENNISYLSKKFSDYTFERCNSSLSDWEQMLLMSLCNHNIIANSSFSWWSAYFNEWENKIICYPYLWFNNKNLETKDLCPKEWKKIYF